MVSSNSGKVHVGVCECVYVSMCACVCVCRYLSPEHNLLQGDDWQEQRRVFVCVRVRACVPVLSAVLGHGQRGEMQGACVGVCMRFVKLTRSRFLLCSAASAGTWYPSVLLRC